MSTIYKYQDSEPAITPATTATPLLSSDPVLAYSSNLGRTVQTTIGSVSALETVTQATSATTATSISPYGFTTLFTSNTPLTWLLTPPPSAGIYKTIYSTSTATGSIVSSTATLISTEDPAAKTVVLSKAGSYVSLLSFSTAAWVVVGRSTVGVLCT